MLFLRRILVGDQDRVLLIRKGRFDRVLGPGEYWVFDFAIETIKFNVTDLVFDNVWADYLVTERPAIAAALFMIVETGDTEVAIVYLNGKLSRVIGPRRASAVLARARSREGGGN
jgi:hypothetical protein